MTFSPKHTQYDIPLEYPTQVLHHAWIISDTSTYTHIDKIPSMAGI